MGRKKGKQSGGLGSKKLRADLERVRWQDAKEDLVLRTPSHQRPASIGGLVVRHQQHQHPPRPSGGVDRRAPPPKPAVAPARVALDEESLVARCAATIGRHMDRFATDAPTSETFGFLPARAVEIIARHARGRVAPDNIELLCQPDVRRLELSGSDLGDDDVARALFPRRRDRPAPTDEWVVRDLNLGLSGCPRLDHLFLDAPVTWRLFYELCRALPGLKSLSLGPGCPPAAVDIVLAALLALETLDLTRCDWFDPRAFVADHAARPACSRDPPARASAPLKLLCCAADAATTTLVHSPLRSSPLTLFVSHIAAAPGPSGGGAPRATKCLPRSREAIFGTGRPRDELAHHPRPALVTATTATTTCV